MALTQSIGVLTQENQTYYESRLLDRALPRLVHARWGQVRPIPQKSGSTVNFRKYGALSAVTSALTEGVTPDPESVTITEVTATLSWYGSFIRYTDQLDLIGMDDNLMEFSDMLGEQAGDSIDQLVRDVLAAGVGATRYANGAGNRVSLQATDIMDNAEIIRAVATLHANKARTFEDGFFVSIISSNTWADMMQDANIVNAFLYAGDKGEQNPLFRGELGTYMGVRWFLSQNAKTYAGTACTTVEATMFMGRDAYGICGLAGYEPDYGEEGGTGNSPMPVDLIVKDIGSAGTADPLNQRGTVGWKAPHVSAVLQSTWLLAVEHGSTIGG